MLNILVDYPTRQEEKAILETTTVEQDVKMEVLLEAADILELQRIVRRVPVGDHVFEYALDLVRKTRPRDEFAPDYVKNWVEFGAGPRAGQNMILGAKARALMHGRFYATTEDVELLALPVMRWGLAVIAVAWPWWGQSWLCCGLRRGLYRLHQLIVLVLLAVNLCQGLRAVPGWAGGGVLPLAGGSLVRAAYGWQASCTTATDGTYEVALAGPQGDQWFLRYQPVDEFDRRLFRPVIYQVPQ
jgi:hypothetical protein